MLQSHYRINLYCKGIDQIIAELIYRFHSKDNDILCALGYINLKDEPKIESFSKMENFYDLNYDLIEWDRRLFTRFQKDHPEITIETASVDVLYKDELKEFLPHFSEIGEIFGAIPALSWAERSFSTLRLLKTYLRSAMAQSRLSHLAMINTERSCANYVLAESMDIIWEKKWSQLIFFLTLSFCLRGWYDYPMITMNIVVLFHCYFPNVLYSNSSFWWLDWYLLE